MSNDLDVILPATEKVQTSIGVLVTIRLLRFKDIPLIMDFISDYGVEAINGNWIKALGSSEAINKAVEVVTICSDATVELFDKLPAHEGIQLFLKCINFNSPFLKDVLTEEIPKLMALFPKPKDETDLASKSPDSLDQGTV